MNVDLPDKQGDIDGVLVGPSGVYVLEIKAFSGTYRNRDQIWEYRSFGRWKPASKNPSKQARANARRLHNFLKHTAELEQWIEARVFWTGDTLILQKPGVPVWQVKRPHWIQQDLARGKPLSDEAQQRIRIALKTYTAGYKHNGK